MSYERLKPVFSLDQEKLEEIKRIVPEAFADGKINWATLKEALGENLEEESSDSEHFGLFWPGKRDARKIGATPSTGTLVPVNVGSVNEENTHNIFIEGENLEVLKLLQKSYSGRIKAIYIDPPYNTGNDFVYEDDFKEPIEEYLRRTGQTDEEGKPLTTNTRADGRFHSRWLSMMLSRIKLAQNLMTEDGAMFVSIDDNELHNLRSLLNEVFGEENFIGQIIVRSNPRGSQSVKHLATVHEYVLIYAKDASQVAIKGMELTEEMKKEYKHSLKDGRKYRLLGLRLRGGSWRREQRPFLFYPVFVDPANGHVSLEKSEKFCVKVLPIKPSTGEEGTWRWGKQKFGKDIDSIVAKQIARDGDDEVWDIFQMDYLSSDMMTDKTTKAKTIWDDKEFNYQNGTTELKKLFGGIEVFDFPKPVYLISQLISMLDVDDGDIILDFFAGSGTTANAVLNLNDEDRSNRRFLLIQMPEPCNDKSAAFKAGYKTIADICRNRIEKLLNILKKKGGGNDIGFKIFGLQKSNYRLWNDYDGNNLSELESKMGLFQNPFIEGAKPQNLLTEILLLEGFPLDSKIGKLIGIKSNLVYEVRSEFCEHKLLVCLDEKIQSETTTLLKIDESDVFICLESALKDEQKMHFADHCKLKTL